MGDSPHNILRPAMMKAVAIDEKIRDQAAPQAEGEDDIAYGRRIYETMRAFWNKDKPEIREVVDRAIPTSTGDVPCRFYYNGGDARHYNCPVLFYLHGGGFILGNLETHDRLMRMHAHLGHCTVIGVDYAKSPESKHPHAINQILDILQFCHDNAAKLNLNKDKLCLSGDSAGAYLSLAAMLRLRDKKSPIKIACALLYYGAFGLMDSPSMRVFGADESYGLSWETMKFYKNCYLTQWEEAYEADVNLLLNDLSGLAPMLIVGLSLDPLLDNSRFLAEKVKADGGICKYSEYDGVLHGCLHYTKILPDAHVMIGEGLSFMWSYLREYGDGGDI